MSEATSGSGGRRQPARGRAAAEYTALVGLIETQQTALAELQAKITDLESDGEQRAAENAELRAHLRDLAESVAALPVHLAGPPRPDDDNASDVDAGEQSDNEWEWDTAPVVWSLLTAEEFARHRWRLYRWVRSCLIPERWPDRSTLVPCWWRHPEALAELEELRRGWIQWHYDPSANVNAGLEWSDRWWPGVQRRLARKLGSCRENGHIEADPPRGRIGGGNEAGHPVIDDPIEFGRQNGGSPPEVPGWVRANPHL